jgi:hypothetical protein
VGTDYKVQIMPTEELTYDIPPECERDATVIFIPTLFVSIAEESKKAKDS